jgi:hypothetical protein
MYKGIALLIALLLLLSTACFADIDQAQIFAVGSTNVGVLTGTSAGAVASFSVSPIVGFQMTTDGDDNTKYIQLSNSSLVQGAGTVGVYGDYGYVQNATASSTQTQSSLLGYLSLGTQSQSVGAAFSQSTISNGLFGSTVASQNFIGTAGQLVSTPYGVSANFVAVGVDSTAGVLVNRSISITRLGI